MRIGVLGTGSVGRTIATKLIELGHEVRMGSRQAGNEAATTWSASAGESASEGSFAYAAGFGELVFNCTAGGGALAAVGSAAAELEGKLLIDVCNPLDFSGDTASLFVGITDSIAEQIQRALPTTSVVKALNTMNASVMTNPDGVPGEHLVFVCGNDDEAKGRTLALLGDFGWPATRVVDCGDLTGARALEAYLLIWLRMTAWVGNARFNIAVQRAD